MSESFSANLDFIYLFYGAAFFFLGTACLILRFRERSKDPLPWLYLSFFGFSHGISDWMEMLAVSFMKPEFLSTERVFFLAVSYVCLIEFSRLSLRRIYNIRIPVYFYGVFFILFFWNIYTKKVCNFCIEDTIRYFLGFPGAVGAFYAMRHYANKNYDGAGRGFYLLASYGFFFSALAILVVPASSFLLSHFLNYSSFLKFTHFPVQLVRGLLATCAAFIFIHRATNVTLSIKGAGKGAGSVRAILISYIFFYLLFLFFGFYFLSVVTRHEHDYLRKVILSDARLLKNAIHGADLQEFGEASTDVSYTKYKNMHKRLSDLAEISAFAKNLYVVTMVGGKSEFRVSSKAQVFPHSFVPSYGQQAPVVFIQDAYHSKQPTVFIGRDNESSLLFMSVFVPLTDLENRVISILGIDMDPQRLEAEVLRIRLYAIFVIMAFLVLLMVGYAFLILFALRSIELEIQKANLDKALLRLKETRAELARSEETFRGILNNSPSAIFGFDRDLRLIFWNHGAEVLYGYMKEELINEANPLLNKKITELFGIVDLEEKIGRVFDGATVEKEVMHRTKDGYVDVAMTLFAVKDPLGRILFAIGLVQDISEHKKHEEKLASAHGQLKALLDAATSFAIIAVDSDVTIRVFNKGAEKMFCVKGEEVIDRKSISQFHLESELKVCAEELKRKFSLKPEAGNSGLIHTDEVVEREATAMRRDSVFFPILLTVSALRNKNSELTGYLIIAFDLTHRRAAEQAFVESQQKYKDLVDNINVGVYTITPGPERKFLEVNPAMLEMFDADTQEELISHPAVDFYINKERRRQFSEDIPKMAFVKNQEIELKSLKGRIFWASVTAVRKISPNSEVYFYGVMQDITEHKRMELQLQEERDRLRSIATSIGAGLSLVNSNFEIVWANETLQNLFGSPSTLKGRKSFEACCMDVVTCNACPAAKCFETGKLQTDELRVNFPDGRVKYFLVIASPIKNESGKVDQVIELALDVTERKRMIELLEYERALSRNVIDSIGEALMVLDCHNRTVLDVNRHYLVEHGVKKEDVIGKKCNEVSGHYCPPCEGCDFERAAKEGVEAAATHIHKRKDGTSAYVDVTFSPLRDDKGHIIGVIHLAKDVSERKRLEDDLRRYSENLESLVKERTRALQKSGLMFRKLFESAQDGILIIEFESGKIIDVNPYFLGLLSCTREDMQGFDYRSILHCLVPHVFEQAHRELTQKVSVYYEDVLLSNGKGKEVPVELQASLYFVEDKKVIQFNIRDLTERKKIEKVKSEFVSMVSHELRTPLSAIKEGVEIVADGTQGKLNKSQIECLGIALANIKRLNRLIGDILDISKIQSNLLRIILAPCNIYDAVDQVYSLVKIEIEKRGMIFVTDLEKDLPLVSVDKDRLIQVLMNLLSNAVKFTRQKSRIMLICRRAGDYVEFGVKDEGAGISREELSQLFGRFVQLDSTLIRRVGGTGLGLYISRNLVEAMGGRIWAESQLEVGSIFWFTLPVVTHGA